ncbi:tetratricopeptide repeat protein [Terriglobus tenax]|uniref:tetratricopeptide repeat protein n=1 Tax=Terriglobus tenax TaxID=1111115 RepID=UPI0021DF99A7|nr:tetratricopeptide repeat protein [Terriglobus tenax]
MDSQTRHNLKQDALATAAENSLDWAHKNRSTAIRYAVVVLVVLLVVVGGFVLYNVRSSAANRAFGEAMETYQADIAEPGVPAQPGVKTYASAQERAKAAHDKFQQVADSYGLTSTGKLALYFSGLTAIEANQTSTAQSTLEQVAGSWNSDLAALAKLSLASLYHQGGQDQKSIDLYNQLIAKPTPSVPAATAQLQLAALYESKGQEADARKIYAQIKDKEAKTAAGSIADQRLNPGAARQ